MANKTKLKDKVEQFFAQTNVTPNGKRKCPLCFEVYEDRGLKNHLYSCISYIDSEEDSDSTESTQSEEEKKQLVDNLFAMTKVFTDGKRKCPLCKEKYKDKGLKRHLYSCINKYPTDELSTRSTRCLGEKKESIYKNSSEKVKVVPAVFTRTQSIVKREAERILVQPELNDKNIVEHYFGKTSLSSDGKRTCPLCYKPFKDLGLKRHLRACIDKQDISIYDIADECKKDNQNKCLNSDNDRVKGNSQDYRQNDSSDFKSNSEYTSSPKPCVFRKQTSDCDMVKIINDSEKLSLKYTLTGNSNDIYDKLKYMTLTTNEIQDNAEKMNDLVKYVIEWLNNNTQLRWQRFNSGSVYEKLKIYQIDEVDCMIVCKLICQKEYLDFPNKSFMTLKMTSGIQKRIPFCKKILNEDGYLSPKLFIAEFSNMIIKALNDWGHKSRGIVVEGFSPLSPAVTLKTRETTGRKSFHIDLVPGIELDGWPEVSSDWDIPRTLPFEKQKCVKDKHHVVGKVHPSELEVLPQKCKMWRISYSSAEKVIMNHLDYGEELTCRKAVTRLLKSDFLEAKSNGCNIAKSYFCKTIMLHMVKYFKSDSMWKTQDMPDKYKQCLLVVRNCIELKYIEHGFIKGENLLDYALSDLLSKSELDKMVRLINNKIKRIS